MSAYVLILTLAMVSYDGGVAMMSVPFATEKACQDAAAAWNNRNVGERRRSNVTAQCHPTGAPK